MKVFLQINKILSPYGNNLRVVSNFYRSTKFCFSEDTKSSHSQRYIYDYEAPEKQEISLQSLRSRILRKLLLFTSISTFIYIFLLRKYNHPAKRYQLYLINESMDTKLSGFASKKLQMLLNHYIYKKDSEEATLVLNIYKRLLEENKIKLEISQDNIFVIDSMSIGVFLFKNGDLFISNRILELAENNQDEIALFIATEISSNLHGKTTSRIFKYIFYEKIKNYFSNLNGKRNKSNQSLISESNFINHKINSLMILNKYLYFYPESKVATVFEESEILRLAIQLVKKANFNIVQSILIFKKFDEKMKHYPRHYTENILVSKESRYFDICKKFIKIYLL